MIYLIPLLLIAAWVILHFVGPYVILQPHRANDRINLAASREGFVSRTVKSKEDYVLSGYERQLASPRAVIIMLHGIGSSKEVYDDLSDWLATKHIASYAFDNRGQGKSEGEFVTFGYYEKYDLQKIIDLATETYPELPLGIWGNSLGGAVALQTLAIDQRLDFAVIESTFARLDNIILAYQKRFTGGIGSKLFTDYALWRAGKIAGFNPDEVEPGEAAKSINVPVFLAHGDSDIHIDVSNGQTIYNNLAGADNQLMIVKGADHSGLYTAGGATYSAAISQFLERQLEVDTGQDN